MRHERGFGAELAGYGVNLGGFKAFGQGEPGQNAGQTLGHHALAATGGTNEHDVVSAGSGHFEGALYALLPFDVGKIKREL